MTTYTPRWLPDSVINWRQGESYGSSRSRHKNCWDLATKDAKISKYERVNRHLAHATIQIKEIHPKFRGLIKGVPTEFVLRSSITQLGVNAEDVKINIIPEERRAEVMMNLVALSPLAVLMLDYISEGALVGKLFATETNRVVRDMDYITRLLDKVNQKGEKLLIYGNTEKPDWNLKIVNGRVIAYLPVLPGTFTYNGEVSGLLPTIGYALKDGAAYKNLLRLHQVFQEGHTRVAHKAGVLMVRSYPMHFRTMFGHVVDELLPKGLKSMSSRVIEPEEDPLKQTLHDRAFVFYGESVDELTHIPIEFYTLESYRENVPFLLRKTLASRCYNIQDVLRVFKTAPAGTQSCCTYICKGGQFQELTTSDWVCTDPGFQSNYASFSSLELLQEFADKLAYDQCEYSVLSAIVADDITSDGVLFTRYFPSPYVKSLLLSRTVRKKLRAIFFTQASRTFGEFFSQEDSSILGDLYSCGISAIWVNEKSGEMFEYARRLNRDAGVFVPFGRRKEYLAATFFGVYGSNLVAGDFEVELMHLFKGVIDIQKNCRHSLLSPSSPLALVTGGGPGAMEVGNRVAKALGMLSCGLYVDFGTLASRAGATINEQKKNPYVEAFFTYRSDKLVERQSDFNLDFPIFLTGGIGTDFEYALEEVRRKVGAVPPNPVILFGAVDYWQSKITTRYQENLRSGTIKGSEWISTVPWVVSSGKEALEVYRDFFNSKLPVGPGHPTNELGFMVAEEYLKKRGA